jgi:hypothetical protein
MPMQRIHADYCGPFLNKYYALIVVDTFSKYPEVFITENATADFTQVALRKFFSREGIAQVLVTDNGTHFNSHALQAWLRKIGVTQVFTAPRHPKSNGQAENFVKTFKSAMFSMKPTTLTELENHMDTFLLQYRNTDHCTTHKTPSFLFKGRNLRTSSVVDSTHVSFFRGNDNRLCQGIMLNTMGQQMLSLMDTHDGSVHRRHRDQVVITPTSALRQSVGEQPAERVHRDESVLDDRQQDTSDVVNIDEPLVQQVASEDVEDADLTLPARQPELPTTRQPEIPTTSTPQRGVGRSRRVPKRFEDFI